MEKQGAADVGQSSADLVDVVGDLSRAGSGAVGAVQSAIADEVNRTARENEGRSATTNGRQLHRSRSRTISAVHTAHLIAADSIVRREVTRSAQPGNRRWIRPQRRRIHVLDEDGTCSRAVGLP